MAEEIREAEVVSSEPNTPAQPEQQGEQIEVDQGTAFSLKIQEFDKKIAEAEAAVADLKKQKFAYIYDENVRTVVMAHKEKAIKAQLEEEARKKMRQ